METSSKEGMTVYELGFHIAPIVTEENIAHEVSLIKSLLEKAKAEVISEDFPRLRALAYPLSKVIGGSKKVFKEAYFGWVKFEAVGEEVVKLSKEVEKMENILRFLLIKTVRENTLYGNKFSLHSGAKSKKEEGAKIAKVEKGEVDEVEVDKAIDELVV